MLPLRSSTALIAFSSLIDTSVGLVGRAESVDTRRQLSNASVSSLNAAQIDAYTSYTYYASATYCQPDTLASWSCGTNCDANPTFEVTAAGGDSSTIQFWYVGYDPTLDTVIVAHEGTNTSQILAELTDGDFVLTPLPSDAFPGLPADILVHNGFLGAQQRAANYVLPAVEKTLAAHPTTSSVTLIGHSLGAAIATLDAAYLPLQLTDGSSLTFSIIVYGLPRVGNLAWATWLSGAYPSVAAAAFAQSGSGDVIQHTTNSLTHINNKEDPIPVLPPLALGYHHPIGEVHVTDADVWEACPGMDNPSTLCIVGDTMDFHWNETNHDGPYNGVRMGCPDTNSA